MLWFPYHRLRHILALLSSDYEASKTFGTKPKGPVAVGAF
jgi:hypothetical protein